MSHDALSTERLNELLVKMYQRRIVRALYDDPTKPWLPESYWREEYDRRYPGTAETVRDLVEAAQVRKLERRRQDDELARNASVEALLEEGVPKLLGNDSRLANARWGVASMHDGWMPHPVAPSEVQAPSFDFECFQCGRPITDRHGYWTDHAGRTHCDLALLDAETIKAEDYWTDHQPKPIHGEEQDNGH